MKLQWPLRLHNDAPPPLRPAGHNAAAEALVQPIILLGSTIMATIACYVLAQDQLAAVFAAKASTQDWLVIILVGGLGIMVDTAMVLSASRLRMHLSRGRRDWPWALITGTMLLLCLGVEGMTLLYFGYLTSRSSIPVNVQDTVKSIHDVLFFVRNGMPPLIIAFLTTALLPLTVETADRDRATKASTSLNIAGLQEDLVKVGPLAGRSEKVQALADQMALFEHASHATPDEQARNLALITQLRSQNNVITLVDGEQITKTETHTLIQTALAALDERLAVLDTLEQQFARWAQQIQVEALNRMQAVIAPLQEQILALAEVPEPVVQMTNAAPATPAADNAPRQAPKPGTKVYRAWIRKEIGRAESQLETPTAAMIAARLGENLTDVAPVVAEIMTERRVQNSNR